ncbi:TPA: ATP-dependent helicase [Candidatus Nomurabacteria bacterium]|nr:MAG: UvrD/REP helicase [Parcubacteria bacterium RAAC4_OD1_1]HCY26546.1 ATP-dependent helicase [Candidatus Nomurabacteria bacterium]
MTNKDFEKKISLLNERQREAVEAIEGPVMVVAGPGTGKTEILSLRIGNILKNTDTPPESILCLTFTNSGVSAMKERLERYIGKRGREVTISTFHAFSISLIEKYYDLLDFKKIPELLSDEDAIFLVDDILNENEWEYISPLSNRVTYFGELKHLVSNLKRERISADTFMSYIDMDINDLKNNPDSISTRGDSKGEFKKEVLKKIESLERTKEVVEFYKIYEDKKKANSLMDYDDVLDYAVSLVENFSNVRDDIREEYLYILVDEHQDSSGVQNDFIKAIWSGVESPNIFVVGDDRQLIYGFSGANISYFEDFSHIFGKPKLIVLNENYRSTEQILSLADDILQSSIAKEKLNSNLGKGQKIRLGEYFYPRDEIISAGIYFKEKINEGVDPNECALLVPRNSHVKTAIEILINMGLPVASDSNLSLFSQVESDYLKRLMRVITNPFDSLSLSKTLLDETSGIEKLEALTYLKENKGEELNIDKLLSSKKEGLFGEDNSIYRFGKKLENWINSLKGEKLSNIVNILGNDLLVKTSKNNNELLNRVEIVRSFIHLAIMFEEKNKKIDLSSFVEYLDRLESYNTHIELAKFGGDEGIKVMTLHKSKGLEYEAVWIAHMNEEILLSSKKGGFTLPEKIKERMSLRNIEDAKRELYVAITRAKKMCNISYSREGYNGGDLELLSIIRDLPDVHFDKMSAKENEDKILSLGADIYTKFDRIKFEGNEIDEVKNLVKKNYESMRVSVSMLNNFFECPWKWYFRNFLKLPEEKPMHLALGTVVHAMIEFVLKSDDFPKENELKLKIEKEFKKEGIENKIDLKRLSKKAEIAITEWINNYYKKLNKDYKSERSVSVSSKEFPNLTMYGKIDLTEYLGDREIMVTDFKTGNSKTKNMIEKISEDGRMSDLMRQLAMYSYLLEGDEKNVRVVKSRLLFLEEDIENKNALYETLIDQEKIDLLKRDIKDYDESLKSGEFVNNECHFKPYGSLNNECEYCKLANQLFQ